ncbi:MAG: diacylglycerol kinase [Patescibacteria group bacterium]|nr:diacylglycerol kinase [Patescibacteria group bacterium]
MGFKKLTKSFIFAGQGISQVFQEEQSFRIQLAAALVALVLMMIFPLGLIERLIIIMLCIAVLVLEIINSIFERIVDIYKPRLNPYVRDIKDMMAAAVLIASVGALVIGIMIFFPHIRGLWIK